MQINCPIDIELAQTLKHEAVNASQFVRPVFCYPFLYFQYLMLLL